METWPQDMRLGWPQLSRSPQPPQGARTRGRAAGPHCAVSGGERLLEFSQDLWTGSTECSHASTTTSLLRLWRADSVCMPQPHEGKSSYLIFMGNWEILSSVILYWAKGTSNTNVHFRSFPVWAKVSFMVNNCITHVSRAQVLTIIKNIFFLGIWGWLYLPHLKNGLREIALGCKKILDLKIKFEIQLYYLKFQWPWPNCITFLRPGLSIKNI